MATAYTTQDYQRAIASIQFALSVGTHLGDSDLVKILLLLQDASANIAGITPIVANPAIDGTPVDGTGNIPG